MAFFRSLLKSGAITALAGYGWVRLRCLRKPTLLILTYHRILPAEASERNSEQPGMVATPDALRAHIRLIKALGAEPIHLTDWLARDRESKPLPKLAVAFTFDDGWQDNYQHAYPVLKSEGAPATIFLVTRMIDTNKTFWPEQILQLLTSHKIPEQAPAFDWLRPFLPGGPEASSNRTFSLLEADAVVTRLKALDDATILEGLRRIQEEHPGYSLQPDSRAILSGAELNEMSQEGLLHYGAHTRHHYRLNRLKDEATLQDEIVECFKDLNPLGESAVPIFCYPNGDITGKGETLVSANYQAACTTKTGWNLAGCDPFDLHRFNLHDGNSSSSRALLATIGRGLL